MMRTRETRPTRTEHRADSAKSKSAAKPLESPGKVVEMFTAEFTSGNAIVRVTYDPTAILHRASPPGCYRAAVVSPPAADDGFDLGSEHRLLVSVTPRLAEAPGARGALLEVAATALLFIAGEEPMLAFEKTEQGLPMLKLVSTARRSA